MSAPPPRVEIDIDAPPVAVYQLLTTVTRMGEWSSECVSCRWLGRVHEPSIGARFRGTSRNGWHRWSTTSTITIAEPAATFAFAVSYLGMRVAVWRYDLAPNGTAGSRLAESVDDQRGRLLRTVSPFITGSRDRNERNTATMRTTLERLKAAAETAS